MIFALVGNQNCGKTTLFNVLTGSHLAARGLSSAGPWGGLWGTA